MSERRCHVCGCTQGRACFGGCWWIGPNRCSSCLDPRSTPVVFAAPQAVDRIRSGHKTQARSPFVLPADASQVNYYAPPGGRGVPGWAAPGVNYWTRRGNHIAACPYGERTDYLTVGADLRLQITDIGVERLLDISDADCMAEGVRPTIDGNGHDWRNDESGARRTFRQLWQSIHGADAWDENPWVWRIEFKRASE